MDYLKTPDQLVWSEEDHPAPGLVEQLFDPLKVAAPYMINGEKIGYCDLAYYWLACQPDDSLFQKLIAVPHHQKSLTGLIYRQKSPQARTVFLRRTSSSELIDAKQAISKFDRFNCRPCANPYIENMFFSCSFGVTSIVDAIYFLTTTPGGYLITTICQNKAFGDKYQEKKHCFAIASAPATKDTQKAIKVFDWRFGLFNFTDQHPFKLHLLLSTLSNYYIGPVNETTFCMQIHKAEFTKKHRDAFIKTLTKDVTEVT